jgi:Phospholipase_D-nuclease N-terminal
MIGTIFGFFIIGGVLGFLLSAITFVLWLWMLIDCIKRPGLTSNERIVWVLVIIFLPCLGSVIYFFAGRK